MTEMLKPHTTLYVVSAVLLRIAGTTTYGAVLSRRFSVVV